MCPDPTWSGAALAAARGLGRAAYGGRVRLRTSRMIATTGLTIQQPNSARARSASLFICRLLKKASVVIELSRRRYNSIRPDQSFGCHPASARGRHLVRRAKQLSAVHSPRHRHTAADALTLYLGHQMGQAVAQWCRLRRIPPYSSWRRILASSKMASTSLPSGPTSKSRCLGGSALRCLGRLASPTSRRPTQTGPAPTIASCAKWFLAASFPIQANDCNVQASLNNGEGYSAAGMPI